MTRRTDKLSAEDLPANVRDAAVAEPGSLTISVGTPLDQVEHLLIRETLRHAGGDKSVAAQMLGISSRTIYRKLAEMGES